MVSAATTSWSRQETTITTAPNTAMSTRLPRTWSSSPPAGARPRSRCTMSWPNTVAVAISAPLAVDMTAASAAASTRPDSTGGMATSTTAVNASSRSARPGTSTPAPIPTTAPATP